MSAEIETTVEGQDVVARSRASEMFRALSHRNYRLFWFGALLSNVGTWMQTVAQGWLVLKLTDSPFLLGLDGFMASAPGLLLTLIGGVFADLIDRKRLLIYTQIGAGLSALVLAALVMTGVVHWWMILILSFFTGCCMALASPSFQAITIDLVGREDLANAIALNSAQFQLSRVAGPTLAGLAMGAVGLAGCFLLNGLSYIAVIVALMMVNFTAQSGKAGHSVKTKREFWEELTEGFQYVRSRPRVSMLLSISALTSLCGAPYLSMMPLFARNVLGLGETGLALMMGTAGAGALGGALLLVFLGDFRRKGWVVIGGAFVYSLCLMAFAFSTRLALSLVLLFCVGFSITSCVALINTLLQQLVTDQMRGRVLSMFVLSFLGTIPFGSLIAGASADRFGAPVTLATGGLIIFIFITTLAISNKRLRQL
ncbi:MAG TPA: MFS transporter [Pyrinomonadaceae bacterium]|jgi:MFS family permease|nr:MFS transporter [Pyrinomonadaceae bacterium]